MWVITHTTQYKYVLLITQNIIVHVNLLSYKSNINNESQKILSPFNTWQVSQKPTSYWQDTDTNLNNFSPKLKNNTNINPYYDNSITIDLFKKVPDDVPEMDWNM
jgi:hypothetical protein